MKLSKSRLITVYCYSFSPTTVCTLQPLLTYFTYLYPQVIRLLEKLSRLPVNVEVLQVSLVFIVNYLLHLQKMKFNIMLSIEILAIDVVRLEAMGVGYLKKVFTKVLGQSHHTTVQYVCKFLLK